MNKNVKKGIAYISPLLILIVNYFVSRLLYPVMGNWSWVIILPIYYALIFLVITITGEIHNYKCWFKKSEGKIRWRVICVVFFSIFSLPVFFMNSNKLDTVLIVFLSIIYSIINPFFEELYWRRFLLTKIKAKKWLLVLFSTLLFTLNHPIALATLNTTFIEPGFIFITFMFGVIWCVLFLKTNSLRWNYVTHVMVNFASLSVLVFLNLFVPVFSM